MKITVLGATGSVGRRIVNEAVGRGHQITAVLRDLDAGVDMPEGVELVSGDVNNVDDVRRLSEGQDLVIAAIRPPEGEEKALGEMTRNLLDGVIASGVRVIISGGAGGLFSPDKPGVLLIDDPRFVGEAWRDIAVACVEQLQLCKNEQRADWAYVCPSAYLQDGERTGLFRLGHDTALVDSDGASKISIQDLAVAIVDEAERPQFR
ncbi:MAG: NAD(P)H-binding protein, partial [Pseudomonadales bacterium]|nr:NAD(P)H-binding protein [Pseudomonadales bacterium]